MSATSSVHIQVVLFGQELKDVWQLSKAISATARQAKQSGYTSQLTLAFGDCSNRPVLLDADIAALQTSAHQEGIDRLTYEFFNANLGSAGGSNRLAERTDADYILVLNPDTYPAPTLLGHMLSAFHDPSVGAADAHQIPLEHPKEFDVKRGDTSWVSGSCLLVRTDVYRSLQGFDESFFLYCDDVDFSWRIRLLGLRTVHVADAIVFHDKRIRLNGAIEPTPSEDFYGVLGRLRLATKFDRPDLVEATIAAVDTGCSAEQRRAAEVWRQRVEAGDVPDPLPGAADVAQFVDGEYARHRF